MSLVHRRTIQKDSRAIYSFLVPDSMQKKNRLVQDTQNIFEMKSG